MIPILSMLLAALVSTLSASTPVRLRATRATRYDDPGDPTRGGTPSCWRRCLAVDAAGNCSRRFSDRAFELSWPAHVANRWLPCGTVIVIQRVGCDRRHPKRLGCDAVGRSTIGVVLDRGPYNTDPRKPGDHRTRARGGLVYRGDLDMSPGVSEALSMGLEEGRADVRWWTVGRVGAE